MGFRDNISDFYHWMVQFGNVNTKSRTNYISWLKFMAGRYELDVDLSEDKIQTIINDERRALSSRTIYKSEKDLVNFKSALRKYKQFLDSNYSEVIQETILSETRKVQQDNSITLTEKNAIIKSRIGQGLFRERLISKVSQVKIHKRDLT